MTHHSSSYAAHPIPRAHRAPALGILEPPAGSMARPRSAEPGIGNLVGTSERMVALHELIRKVAPTMSTILIQGETGTGKELTARAIHAASRGAHRPFVPVDCNALSESLLESELFGHVKGAFTGALTDKKGLVEAAQGGTCFLDEVGGLSPCVQAKLLRVLQEHEVRPVGGAASLKVDVRIIAATNKELDTLVADGRFREDLFYRLSVVTIGIPPLRDRREDVPLLAEHFLRSYADRSCAAPTAISPAALDLLVRYEWPGNVRELAHAIERAVALTSNATVLPEDLPPKLLESRSPGHRSTDAGLHLRGVVAAHVGRVLRLARWNKKRAAQLLGIHRRTLYRLTKRYRIPLGEG